jgi:type II secretory pathway component PulK
MTFDLPNLTAFMTVFFAVAALAAVVAVGTLVSFFSENRPTRVRRHESVAHYYGHLVLGH